MNIHQEPSDLAGKTVKIKDDIEHPQQPNFGGADIRIEDWWDRVSGKSWKWCDGNPACLVFAFRSATSGLPTDDEVLYGKTADGLGHLVHVSELHPLESA